MPFAKDFRVMMIDDDPAFLVTLGDALRGLGITNFLKAKSGADAKLKLPSLEAGRWNQKGPRPDL